MPAISVVIPTFNRAKYLSAAIQSVLDQTYTDYEVIVIDDGSTDDTKSTLQAWTDAGQIRYHYQENAGVSAARNSGIAMARGQYIAFLDSDDLFLPQKLEKQIAAFERSPDLAFVHCHFIKFDDQGQNLGQRDTSRFTGRIYPQLLTEWSVLMATPCMLMRSDVLEQVGGYDPNMDWAEDLDLWRRITRHHPIDLVPEVLVKVRAHSGGASQQKIQAVPHFRRYLDKSFADDPGLSAAFKRRCYATMYAQMGKNMLGEGDQEAMRQARRLALQSMRINPLAFSAYTVLLASFLSAGIRRTLARLVRKLRYRT